MGEIIQFKKKRIPKGLIISGLGGVSNENGPVSGTYYLSKTFFNIFGSKQKIHEARKNSPEFQFIGFAINK